MSVVRKFVIAELVWGVGITLLILPITILSSEPLTGGEYVQWVVRAFGLAAFPAGIAIADDVFGGARRGRALGLGVAALGGLAVLLFLVTVLVAPLFGGDERTLPELMRAARESSNSWETRNAAAWRFYRMLLVPVQAMLLGAMGAQVAVWAQYGLPASVRRIVYWIVALGVMVAGYGVADSTYETIVLQTAGDVGFAAIYTLLVPLGICAGLGLPTLALVRGTKLERGTG